MKVVGNWTLTIVCNTCGVKLEIDVNDIKAELVGNFGQTGNLKAHQIPEYSTECPSCKKRIMVQRGFSGMLPYNICKTAESNSGVDTDKIKYDI